MLKKPRFFSSPERPTYRTAIIRRKHDVLLTKNRTLNHDAESVTDRGFKYNKRREVAAQTARSRCKVLSIYM